MFIQKICEAKLKEFVIFLEAISAKILFKFYFNNNYYQLSCSFSKKF